MSLADKLERAVKGLAEVWADTDRMRQHAKPVRGLGKGNKVGPKVRVFANKTGEDSAEYKAFHPQQDDETGVPYTFKAFAAYLSRPWPEPWRRHGKEVGVWHKDPNSDGYLREVTRATVLGYMRERKRAMFEADGVLEAHYSDVRAREDAARAGLLAAGVLESTVKARMAEDPIDVIESWLAAIGEFLK